MSNRLTDAAAQARHRGRRAAGSPWLERMARGGLVALGAVHLVLGWLCVQLALGGSEGLDLNHGRRAELAHQPFGAVLVWAVAVGMFLLVLWQAVEAAVGHRDEDGTTRWRKRATSAGKAVVYATIAVSAFKAATGQASGSEKKTDSFTARLMDLPAGQVLVGLVALGILVVAGVFVAKGVTDGFLKKLSGGGRSGRDGVAYTWLGRIGYVAKGLALGVVGILFGYAAITHESKKSGGLDQALTTVLDQPFGPVLIAAIGVGFAAYGAFCFAWARHFD